MTNEVAVPEPQSSFAARESDARSWLLAIDTATDQAGIALFDGTTLWSEHWPSIRTQTTGVPPAIDALLRRSGVFVSKIGAIAVSTGPGSFTGLRVGLSFAKGMVLSDERVVIGVPTLDVVAEPYRVTGVGCIAAIPAGRGRVVWARYPGVGPHASARNTTFDELEREASEEHGTIVAGELLPVWRERLAAAGVPLAPAAYGLQRAGVLAEIGVRRWRNGDLDDPAILEPLYLHGRPNPR